MWFQGIAILGFCFTHEKGLTGLKLLQVLMHTKLPTVNFFQKLIIFCCLIFKKFEKYVSKSGVLWPIAWAGAIKMFIRFFKIVPLRAPRLFIQKVPKWRGVFIKMSSLPIVITNSFRIPIIQKFENIFTYIFSFSFTLGFILFF